MAMRKHPPNELVANGSIVKLRFFFDRQIRIHAQQRFSKQPTAHSSDATVSVHSYVLQPAARRLAFENVAVEIGKHLHAHR
jgi:hypothetical protein